MAEKDEVVYEEVELDEIKSEETELKDDQTTGSRNIPGGRAVMKRANQPGGSLSKRKLLLIFVGVALLVAVSSAAITAIILTMNFDSRLRENARDISLKHGDIDQDQLRDSFEEMLANSHRYKDLTSNFQQIDNAITSLREDSNQHNRTLLKEGARVSSLNDSLEDVKTSVDELISNSHRYKNLSNNVQQNDDAITSLREEAEQLHVTLVRLNTTQLKHGAIVSSLNDSIEDVKASVETLNDNSHRYKDLTSNVQQIDNAITSLREESNQQNRTLFKEGARFRSLNDSLEDFKATVEALIDNSHHYKDLTNNVQQNDDAITSLREEAEQLHATLVRLNTTMLVHGTRFSSLHDSIEDVKASVEKLNDNSHRYEEDNNRTVQHNNEAITNLLAQSQHGNTTLLEHDAILTSLKDAYVDLHASVMELHKDHQQEIVSVALALEQRIYNTIKDEKNVRKQFEKQMKTDFKTANNHTELKFTTLTETLSAVIDRKLDTIEDKVSASVTVLNEASSSIANITIKQQLNDKVMTSLLLESDKLNATLLTHGTKLETIEVDLATKVEELIDNSHRYKVCLHAGKLSEDGLCECVLPYYGYNCEKEHYTDCYDIHNQTDKPTGVYTVKPRGLNVTIQVQCDMTTQGGSWTVFQYRYDGSLDFYRNFEAYENGFGNMTGELWLGLRYIHAMTSSTPTLLRVELEASDGTTAYQEFDDFSLSEGPDYILHIGTSSGTAGDSGWGGLSWNKGSKFSTYDRDVDRWGDNCAVRYHGAWWYRHRNYDCTYVNLNGEYAPPGSYSSINDGWGGMYYYDFKTFISLKTSKMMFRRK